MKKQGLIIVILLGLLGMGWFILANCGGAQLIQNIETTGAKGWESVGPVGASELMAQDIKLFVYHGTPYLVYYEKSKAGPIVLPGGGGAVSGVVRIRKYNGSDWEYIGGPDYLIPEADYTSLFVYNGIPYLSFADSNDYGTGGKNEIRGYASVEKYEGGKWENVGKPAFSAGKIMTNSLFIDNGMPYIAFHDTTNHGLTVMKYNGTDWENVGPPLFASPIMQKITLIVYQGVPYVAFSDYNYSNKASVMKFNGADWEYIGLPGFSKGIADYVSMDIYNDTPYVAYTDLAYHDSFGGQVNTEETIAKATVMKYNGTTWESVGNPGFSDGAMGDLSFSLYNGIPYVAFRDESLLGLGRASVMKYNGKDWEYVGGQGFTGTHAAMYTSIFVENSIPYIAYRDIDNNGRAAVMKYIE